jgi:transcriptional regulator with GAF, ATPase, and Fis domain
MTESPTSRLAEAFVTLTDTLVTDFDIADLFHELAGACVELLEVTAAGLMLVDAGGRLRVMSSSSERSRLLELMEIQNEQGPCLDCHREGGPVLVADLAAERARWPGFAEEAMRGGFRAAYALPMRLRSDTIGALNLFHRDPDTVTAATLRIGQALADVATIAILQQRAARAREDLVGQLQTALNSRVIIEQAKGVLAEREHADMSTAFSLLRGHARSTHQQLSDVARAVVAGELGTDHLQAAHTRDTPPIG